MMAMPSVFFRARWASSSRNSVRRQVDLGFVASDDGFRAVAEASEKHQHLLGRGILRFVEDDEGVVQRASAHVGQRRDFDRAPFGVLSISSTGSMSWQRVVERAEIGRDFS